MAVRHGYGKMAGTDALVFAYDTGDTRNSYRGEPTENVLVGVPNGADCIWAPQNYGQQGGVTIAAAANEYYSEARPHIFRIKSTNDTGYNMMNQQSAIQNQSGTTYTYSYEFKQLRGSTQQDSAVTVYGNGYKNPDSTGYASNMQVTNIELPDGWTRRIITYTATYTGYNYYRFNLWTGGARADGAGDFEFLFDNFKLEVKDHYTPFTNSTRSATQGLLDLTGTSSIDISNVSFDSNAQMTWDGTNDYVRSDATAVLNASTYLTLEAVIKPASTYSGDIIILGRSAYYLTYLSNDSLSVYWYGKSPAGYHSTSAGTIQRNVYNHIVAVWDDANVKLYINGTLLNTVSSTGTGNPVNTDLWIGSEYNGAQRIFNGQIPIAKIYNKALTAAEVQNNYRHYKTRFNI